MIIKNGLVYQEDKKFVKRDLYLEHGRIVEKPYSEGRNCGCRGIAGAAGID